MRCLCEPHGRHFTVDVLQFVEPKKGGLRKRLNRHLFGHSMPQLGDDDIIFSTPLFNATPQSSGRSRHRSRHEEAVSDPF